MKANNLVNAAAKMVTLRLVRFLSSWFAMDGFPEILRLHSLIKIAGYRTEIVTACKDCYVQNRI